MKTLRNIIVVLVILFFVWFIVSYLQIISQNLDFENSTILSNWNFFRILLDMTN